MVNHDKISRIFLIECNLVIGNVIILSSLLCLASGNGNWTPQCCKLIDANVNIYLTQIWEKLALNVGLSMTISRDEFDITLYANVRNYS